MQNPVTRLEELMETKISEIANGIYRLSTFVPEIAPPTNQARRQLLEKGQHVTPLQLPAHYHPASGINTMHLEDRLSDVETNCRDRIACSSSES
jgi:hypothetical protein